MNDDCNFVKIIREICAENQITVETFSHNWIWKLTKNNLTKYIFDYSFDLNPSVATKICRDKSAATDIMNSLSIPNVQHHFFINPEEQFRISNDRGNYEEMLKFLDKYGKVVAKDNTGSGGNLIFLANNQSGLELAAHEIFGRGRNLALSPFEQIEHEYRIVLLDDQPRVIFEKVREVDSAGQSTEWRHNLGKGAHAKLMSLDSAENREIIELAQYVTKTFGLRFASCDAIKTVAGQLKIIEINTGVDMEYFSKQGTKEFALAKEIYRDAIDKMFEC